MIEAINIALSPLLILGPAAAITAVAAIVSAMISLCYKFMVDQAKAKAIKARTKELQEEMKKRQKENDVEGLNALMKEAMKNNSEQMKLTFKPMMVSFLLAALTLPWLNANFQGISITLPVSLPLVGNIVPFGWIGWYFVSSIPFVFLTRKLLKVEI